MKDWLQRKFINFLVHHLFNFVTEDDLLRMQGQAFYFQGKKLSKESIIKLKADAKTWKESLIWQIISTEAKYRANERMFEKSMNVSDILMGKAMLYSIDIIEKKLEQLSN